MEYAPANTKWQMPVRSFSPLDKNSFAYETVVKRWPTILTQIISTVSTEVHNLTVGPDAYSSRSQEKINEGKVIIQKISSIKHDMSRDKPLDLIEEDGGSNIDVYNDCLRPGLEDRDDAQPWTWFKTSWLFAECYLYRRIRNFFAMTRHWKEYDPFFAQKEETYKSSSAAIVHLAKSIEGLKSQPGLKKDFEEQESPLEIMFYEMAQANLWGNATDLSLLVDLKYEDIQKLQSVGKAAQEANAKFILRNDLPMVWDHLKRMKGGRVDFVLDNAGFELYTDFIFADFLLTFTDFVDEVVFHPKTIPWFVSDVLPADFIWAIDVLQDTSFFAQHTDKMTKEDQDALTAMSARWQSYVADGKFKLSVPLDTKLGQKTEIGDYWTGPYSYQHLPEKDPKLLEELKKSDLVIFKGDLNYRKLLGDGKWISTTSFEEVLGPLAGEIHCVSLRTNKADNIAGLQPGIEQRLDVEDVRWRVSGKWAVISFSPRTM